MAAPPYPPVLNPDKSVIILVVGTKGSGKSTYAERIFREYPYDKLVIDPTGDAEPREPFDAHRPSERFPTSDERWKTLHVKVKPTDREAMDKALGMGLNPPDRPCLVWVDEVGLLMQPNSTLDHTGTALMSSRHYGPMSLLMCGPRPTNIDPLAISQADRVVIYELPNPKDVERLANNMGYSYAKLRGALELMEQRNKEETEQADGGLPYWHIVWERGYKQLWLMRPLPSD